MQQPPNPYPQYPQFQQPQPNYTQPQTYYPLQQEWQQSKPLPPQQPLEHSDDAQPPTKSKTLDRTLWILVGVVIGLVFGLVLGVSYRISATSTSYTTTSQDTAQVTTQPTITPTSPQAPTWITTHTFTGNGTKKTGFFTVPDNWKLVWKCDPSSSFGGEYNVQVFVYGSDNSLIDLAVNTICKAGNTGDSTDEHQGGQIYLDVNSEAAWTIQVQELH